MLFFQTLMFKDAEAMSALSVSFSQTLMFKNAEAMSASSLSACEGTGGQIS